MEDDGLYINLQMGDAPLVPQVKFTGGRWRDRNKAKRDFKRQHEEQPSKASHSGGGGSGSGDIGGGRFVPGDKDRPAKRRRVEGGGGVAEGGGGASDGLPSQSRSRGPTASYGHKTAASGGPRREYDGVTSRLFSSNPEAVTDFANAAAADDGAEPVQPSNAPLSDEASTFQALGLSRRLALHLSAKMGMKAPTEIQSKAVPQLVRDDDDVFLQAETGSGKTLSYLLPILQRLLALSEANDGTKRTGTASSGAGSRVTVHRKSGLFAIILAPTRELCRQIATVLERLRSCAPWIISTAVAGGESKHKEKSRLRKGVNILIATPGRLADHLESTEALDVRTVRWLVLDEGDRLMELGFEKEIRAIVGHIRKHALTSTTPDGLALPDGVLPARRVTVLCSATMKMTTQTLGEISLVDAVHVSATGGRGRDQAASNGEEHGKTGAGGEEGAAGGADASNGGMALFSAPAQLKQSCLIVPAKLRLVTLIALLRSTFARKGTVMKAMIFVSCADSVDFLYELLRSPNGFPKAVAPGKIDSDSDDDSGDSEDDDDSDDEEDKGEEVVGKGSKSKAAKKPKPAAPARHIKTESTTSPAAYITSPANHTIVLHRLHGSLEQPVRTATLAAFTKEKNPAVLLSTDISSRGLDVPDVDLVIEYDPAFQVEDHFHRIGRTARAGRPGKAVLFLQPGCEEGYLQFLEKSTKSSSAATAVRPLSYEHTLQTGFLTPIDFPEGESTEKSWNKRAEELQLHLEQRLLKGSRDVGGSSNSNSNSNNNNTHKNGHKNYNNNNSATVTSSKLLESARVAFRSHIRAYTTHVRAERDFFDKTQLHLGHMAKSFGLRETPAGIGGHVYRQIASGQKNKTKAGGNSTSSTNKRVGGGGGGRARGDSDDEGGLGKDDPEEKARQAQKMAMGLMALMNPASEFNIG